MGKAKAFLYIILAGIFWGTSGLFVHALAPYGLSAVQMTTIRGVVSVVCMTGYAFLRDRTLFGATPKQLLLYFFSGISMLLTATCYYASMQMTSVSTAVVLMYTAPILVMIYSVLFLGERLTVWKTVAVVGMLIGCGLVSGIIGGLKFDAVGILVGVVSGISYSAYNIITKIQMRKKCRPYSASMYCFVFMMFSSLLVSKPMGILHIAAAEPFSILLMIGCGIFTAMLPYLLYTKALKALPAGTVSSMAIVEPMAATVFSVLFLQERLDAFSIGGIVLILISIALLGKAEQEGTENE